MKHKVKNLSFDYFHKTFYDACVTGASATSLNSLVTMQTTKSFDHFYTMVLILGKG